MNENLPEVNNNETLISYLISSAAINANLDQVTIQYFSTINIAFSQISIDAKAIVGIKILAELNKVMASCKDISVKDFLEALHDSSYHLDLKNLGETIVATDKITEEFIVMFTKFSRLNLVTT